MALNSRQIEEREFWNTSPVVADQRTRWGGHPFEEWRVSQPIVQHAIDFLMPLAGKRILLCSVGPEAIPLARAETEVWGFDISSAQIAAVQDLAEFSGVADKITLRVMPFETLDFPDNFFDAAYGQSVLHHVNMDHAGCELKRVLKPGGRGSFTEPLGVNPVLEFARNHLPYPSKDRSRDEKPLGYREIEKFGRLFKSHSYQEFSLFSMFCGRIISNKHLVNALIATDRVVLKRIPFVRPMCRQIWIGIEAE